MKAKHASKSRNPIGGRWFGSNRSQNIYRVRDELERDGYPRLQMALIVALTGGVGFGCSYGLLQAGIDSMALRYPIALGLAYLFFLFLIWLWLRTTAADWVDGGLDIPNGSWHADARVPFQSGGGGDFGGGGASASFEAPDFGDVPGPAGDALGSVDIGVDADELAIPLAVIALLVGMALASLYVVYVAPMLLAEVLVDGAISYALYRRLKRQELRHWLVGVFRHTAWPFVVTAIFLAGMGWGLAKYAPGAHSIGQVMAYEHVVH
jgi:hypothetical protein